jgi:hypothetical protein
MVAFRALVSGRNEWRQSRCGREWIYCLYYGCRNPEGHPAIENFSL